MRVVYGDDAANAANAANAAADLEYVPEQQPTLKGSPWPTVQGSPWPTIQGSPWPKTTRRGTKITIACLCFLCCMGGMFAFGIFIQNVENARIIDSQFYRLITANITRKWIAPSGQNQNPSGQNPSDFIFQITAFNFPERRFAWSYAEIATSASWYLSFSDNDNTIVGYTKAYSYYDDPIYGPMITIARKSDVQLAIKFDYRDTSKKSVDSLFDALP